MIKVIYKGTIYKGITEKEVMLKLRNDGRLSLKVIGILMSMSKQNVAQILGNTGRIQYPELSNPVTFDDSDEVVALRIKVPISKVAIARRALGIKAPIKVDLDKRREMLSQYLFGKNPGLFFVKFMIEQLKKLSLNKAKLLNDFYLFGSDISLADNLNRDTKRVYRSLAKKELKKLATQYDVNLLIEEGVLNAD